MNHMNGAAACRCGHHKLVPILIALIGLAFLLQALGVLSASFVGLAWPVGLILIGGAKLKGGGCRCYARTDGGGM
jgi:hypothetical protein